MRRFIGIGCILLGILCLLTSAGFVFYNHKEAEQAGEASRQLLHTAQSAIKEQTRKTQTPELPEASLSDEASAEAPDPNREMTTIPVSGYDCIGVLSIPVLELELPVFAGWSYEKLRIAPCHYFGSCYGSDFVIAAHNYPSHFGRLSELRSRDLVLFTDAEGTVHTYEVVLLETLPGTATEEMITSGFDLSLYTCTPGGSNRVTVRCARVDP